VFRFVAAAVLLVGAGTMLTGAIDRIAALTAF